MNLFFWKLSLSGCWKLSLSKLWLLIFCIPSLKQENGTIIYWSEKRPLTWNDYKGQPQKRFAAASTTYDIIKSVSKDPGGAKVSIQSVFFCNRSWKKGEWVSDDILMHEQKHFDIVEIYARKLRRLIKDGSYTSFSQLKQKTDSLYDVIDKELDTYQDLYDDKTDGSMNGQKQREWNGRILKELSSANEYREPEIYIRFN